MLIKRLNQLRQIELEKRFYLIDARAKKKEKSICHSKESASQWLKAYFPPGDFVRTRIQQHDWSKLVGEKSRREQVGLFLLFSLFARTNSPSGKRALPSATR